MTRLELASLMLILFIIVNYYFARRRVTTVHRMFSALLWSGALNVLFDIVFSYTKVVDLNPNMILGRIYLGTFCFYMFNMHLYVKTVVNEARGRAKIPNVVGLVLMVAAVISIAVMPIKVASYEAGFLAEGNGISILMLICAIFAIDGVVLTLMNFKAINERSRLAILFATLAQVGTLVAQILDQWNIVTSIAPASAAVMIFIISENPERMLIEQLEYERDRANVANNSKSSFVAHVSHEIRTPINAILGMDEMILRESREENVRQYAADISQAAHTLYSIINDVLDVSRMESGRMDIFPVEYKLDQLVYDALYLIKPRVKEKQLDLIVDINPSLPNSLFGDDVHIKQIVSNLLSNAVKYTHQGFVKLTIDGEYKGNLIDLRFEIKDTGIGIKEEDMSKLFVAFERIEESRNRNIEGTGLGMNITNDLLRLMGSRLNVSSVYGEGSIFSFILTQRIVSQDAIGDFKAYERRQEAPSEISFTAPSVRLLVVDDNNLNRRVFKSLLSQTQMQIDEADSGKKCLELIREEQYDIIFLDHEMPEMDGVETMRNIKSTRDHLNTKTPVIMLTANAIGQVKEIYREAGFNAYLSKPIFNNELERLIKTYIPSYKFIASDTSGATLPIFWSDSENWKDELPKVRGIDWDEAIKHLPTKDILLATICEFRRDIDDEAAELDEYFADIETGDNLNLFKIKVHALKSSARLIGAGMLSEGAQEIEDACKENNLTIVREKYPYMINYYRSFRERLEAFNLVPETRRANVDYPQVIALIEMVRLELQDMNKTNALDALKEAEVYEFPDEVKKNMVRLRNAVEEFDVELSFEISEALLKDLRQLKNSTL